VRPSARLAVMSCLALLTLLSLSPRVQSAQQIALPDIDTSESPNGIVAIPDDAPAVFREVFAKYTKLIAPNGKPIHFLAQDGWSDARILKARNVMQHVLTDVPGSRYGADKSIVANAMADRRATMVLFNTEPELRDAFENTDLERADLSMQDLRANECPVEGHEDYMAHRTRDASFEEIIHLVHDYGIKPALPEMQDALRAIDADATARGIWRGWPEDEVENHPNEYLGVIYDNYLDLWTVMPTLYEGRPIEAGDVPEGHTHFGAYGARGREAMRDTDPQGLAIVQEFFPPFLTRRVGALYGQVPAPQRRHPDRQHRLRPRRQRLGQRPDGQQRRQLVAGQRRQRSARWRRGHGHRSLPRQRRRLRSGARRRACPGRRQTRRP